jgi:hypothetical protein
MATQDVHAERAARLIEALRQQRDQGGDYPLPLARLRERAGLEMTDEEALAALKKKPYTEQVAAADRKSPAGPIALAEDAARLAGSPLLLEFALGRLCTVEAPLQPVNKVVGQVDKALRAAFQEAVEQRAAAGDWPRGVGTRTVKNKLLLFLEQFPPPAPPKAPAEELAERLLQALEARRAAGGDGYPPSLAQLLAEVAPDAKSGLVKKALAAPPLAAALAVAVPGQPDAPIALASDAPVLAAGPQLLLYLLGRAKKHPVAVTALAEGVAEPHRPAFLEAARRAAAAPPAGVGARTEGEESYLYLEARVPPEARLCDRLLGALRAHQAGGEPLTLQRLRQEAAADVPAELFDLALKDRSLKGRLLLSLPGDAEAPVGLAGDEERLARSPLLLERAVAGLSTAEHPFAPVAKVVGRVASPLREAFRAALEKQVEEGTLPPAVASGTVKGKPHLRLSKYPPPRPLAEVLAERWLGDLRAQRDRGTYPVVLTELLQGADPRVTRTVPAFAEATVTAGVSGAVTLVALAEDRDRLLSDGRLLEAAVQAVTSPDNQAVPLPGVKKKVTKELQGAFVERLERLVVEGKLPSGIGSLRISSKPYLFLAAHVGAPQPPAPPKPPPEPEPEPAPAVVAPEPLVDFGRMFDSAFERLDREKGAHNLVSLVQLRQEVPVDRGTFDRELQQLRRAGRYSLSGAEGRHGLSAEEREAGIPEEGSLLLFVSRRADG